MARGSGTRKGWFIDMTKENTDKEDDGGTGGDDTPGGDQAESGGTVGAADSHISDADSGTAGIAGEMSVQKAGSPDHRDHGEGSTTDTAEPAGDTVPGGGLSNPDSIFPAVVAVPAEVVDRLDELLADTNDKVKLEPDANPEGSNSKKVKQKKSKAKTKQNPLIGISPTAMTGNHCNYYSFGVLLMAENDMIVR